jgi:hypothetical protein
MRIEGLKMSDEPGPGFYKLGEYKFQGIRIGKSQRKPNFSG